MDLRKLKEKASEAFTKGKWAKAAELYEAYCSGDPRDLQARLRMGDAFAKAGARERAIGAYKFAAEGYARDGFLPRAIAASKLILELDPSHRGVQQMLADLYARRGVPDASKRKAAPGGQAITGPAAAAPAPAAAAPSFGEIDLPAEEPLDPAPPPPSPPPPAPAIELDDGGPADGVDLEVDGAGGVPAVDLSAQLPPELDLAVNAPPAPKSAPPGLRPRRAQSQEPGQPVDAAPVALPPPQPPPPPAEPQKPEQQEEIVELTVRKTPVPAPPPAEAGRASRIWLPQSYTPPPGATPPPPPPAPEPAQAPAATAAGDSPRKHSSDIEAGLAALARFDELDLDMAPRSPPALEQPTAPAPAPAPAPTSPRGKPPGIRSFAELELEGDSLLHAVEMAAQAGIAQRAESPETMAQAEEAMTGVAEDFQGEATTPAGLPKIPLFSDLSPDAFIELFERCPLRRFGPGEKVLDQGSVGDSFFVICAGAVKVVREDDGKTKELATLQEGEFFGEMALLSGAPRTASVISHAEETQLLEISATVLAQLSHRYPQVAAALKKFCRQRLLANIMTRSPLFKPFNRKDRKALVERFRARDVQKNDLIIREGASSDGLYVVLSGEVEVTKGKTHLASLKEGEIFGEMSLLQKAPATATVAASKRTSLLRLPREDFDQIILTHPQVLMLVSELSEERKRQTEAALSGEMLV
jgi:CRP-like cAMP-binding protein